MPRRKRVLQINPLIFLGLAFISSGMILMSARSNNEIKNIYDDILSANTVRGTVFGKIIDNIREKSESEKDKSGGFTDLVKKLKKYQGTYALYIKDLKSEKEYVYNETESMYAASLFKTPIAVATLKQIQDEKITINQQIPYLSQDMITGTGSITSSKLGTQYTVDQLITKLMKESDNAAQSMLTRTVGLGDIKVSFEALTEAKDTQYFHVNESSPKEVGTSIENLIKTDFLNETNKRYLINIMSETSFDNRISDNLNQELKFAHKIGSWGETGSWHDCGYIYSEEDSTELIVCLMTKNTSFNEVLSAGKDIADFVNLW